MIRTSLLFFAVLFLIKPAMAEDRCTLVWQNFKTNFIVDNQRVMDGKITHSEGQTYAMLLAVKHNDKALFDSILGWTVKNMGEFLKAWSYQDGKTTDIINASDADIMFTWALFEAYEKWGDKSCGSLPRTPSEVSKMVALAIVER